MSPENKERVKAIAEQMRAALLSLEGREDDYEDLRTAALSAMDVCLHCGADERGRVSWRRCQCWNDE